MNAGFQYFSDPFFTSDYYTRSEGGLLSAVLSKLNPTGSTPVAQQPNLAWNFTGKLDFSRLVKLPFLQTVSIPNIGIQAAWQSNTRTGLTDPQASDPGRSYYYLSSITAPNISINVAGDILRIGTTSTPTTQPTAAAAPGAQPGAAAAGTTATAATGAAMPAPTTPSGTQSTPATPPVAPLRRGAIRDAVDVRRVPGGGVRCGLFHHARNAGAGSAPTPGGGTGGPQPGTAQAAVEVKDPGKGIHMPHAPAEAPKKPVAETVRIPFRTPPCTIRCADR